MLRDDERQTQEQRGVPCAREQPGRPEEIAKQGMDRQISRASDEAVPDRLLVRAARYRQVRPQTMNEQQCDRRGEECQRIERQEVHHRNRVRNDNDPSNLELWVTPQPRGGRAEDLVAFYVRRYPELAAKMLAQLDQEGA